VVKAARVASRGKRPKLSAACSNEIQRAAEQVKAGLRP
jgi:hypothetical protein